MAEGLNGTLSNRLAKKKVEMLGYATSCIKSRALLNTRIVKQVSKKGQKSCQDTE